MPLLNNKCSRCHSSILGRPKSMGRIFFIDSFAEKFDREFRTRKEDLGEMIKHITERREIARCPACGRTEKLRWYKTSQEKEWKGGD